MVDDDDDHSMQERQQSEDDDDDEFVLHSWANSVITQDSLATAD